MTFASVQEERDFVTAQRGDRQPKENEYIGADGYLHCKVCGERTESIVPWFTLGGVSSHLIPGQHCACVRAEEEKQAAQKERQKREERRDIAFHKNVLFRSYTFAKDDTREPVLTDRVRRFVDDVTAFSRKPKEQQWEHKCTGLLLYGKPGGGKTFMAGAACNALCERGLQPILFNICDIAEQMRTQEGALDRLCGYPVWFIDDYGAERNTEWMQGQVYQLIDTAIRRNIVLFVTSNLEPETLTNPKDEQAKRIYSRLIGECDPVWVKHQDRRIEKAAERGKRRNAL